METVIPYVAAWSSEGLDSAFIAKDPLCDGKPCLFTLGARGEGTPVLGKLHEARQRQCMVLRRCQVCFEPIDYGRGVGISMGRAVGFSTMLGQKCSVVQEPPTCIPCAVITLARCSGVKRQRAAGTLTMFRVRSYVEVLQLVVPDGPLGHQARALGGVGAYVKAALTRAKPITPEEFLAHAGGCPHV